MQSVRTPLLLALLGVCAVHGQISGVVSSALTGRPIAGVLVMGEGVNWVETNEDGEFILPKDRFRGSHADTRIPITFLLDGYMPVTQIAELGESTVLNIALQAQTNKVVPICRTTFRRSNVLAATEMRFALPPGSPSPRRDFDVDYGTSSIDFRSGQKTFSMRTMYGALCCGGHPLSRRYLDSTKWSEHAWVAQTKRRTRSGLDSRGTKPDGTHWRWVGPLVGEMAEYDNASDEAARYFDSILDTMCIAFKY